MDKYVILSDVTKNGMRKLLELQAQGSLSILESEAVVVNWNTEKDLRDIAKERVKERGIEFLESQLDDLVKKAHERWLYTNGSLSDCDIAAIVDGILDDMGK